VTSMRETFAEIAKRLREGRGCAVATLTALGKARPAPVGTSLLVDVDGSFVGNIGAGCHEAEIIKAGQLTIEDSVQRSLEFDMTDELLDGSACGASLRVTIWKPSLDFLPIADCIAKGAEAVTIAVGGASVTIPARRRLILVGATALASQLASTARAADFHVTIVDPRPAFATRLRQPVADDLVISWPQDVLPQLLPTADALVVIAHDAKLDLPALECALNSSVPYVGALGSIRAQSARRASLAERGYDEDSLNRIHGPVGLDVGAVTNSQIACAILAEMLKVLNGRSGDSLSRCESSKTGDVNSLRRLVLS